MKTPHQSLPFQGDGGIAATITAHFQQAAPSLPDVLPWAGPELDWVITALAKDPARRYATAGALAAAVALQDGGPATSPRGKAHEGTSAIDGDATSPPAPQAGYGR